MDQKVIIAIAGSIVLVFLAAMQMGGSGKGFSGCLTKEDFVTKTYAELDGTCDNTITALPEFK